MRQWQVWVAGMLVLAGSAGHAAVVTLRNGQKIEGAFAGATARVLTVTVGSQTVEFPVSEVLSVVFGAPPAPAPVVAKPATVEKAPAEALVRKIQDLVEAAQEGLEFDAYVARLDQVRGDQERFAAAGQGVDAALRAALGDAVGYLDLAEAVWDAKRTRKGREGLSENPYLDRCAQTDADLQTVVRPGDDALKRGIGASVVGPRPFFACAKAEAERAKTLLPP